MRLRNAHKITALFVSFCLILEQSLYADPSASFLRFSQSSEVPIPIKESAFNIPPNLGKVVEAWGGGGRTPSFLLIQDAHGQYAAQKSIQGLLEWLDKNGGIRSLHLEGGIGRQDPDLLRFFKEEKFNLEAAEFLARKAEVSGAELFLLNRTSPSSSASSSSFPHAVRRESANLDPRLTSCGDDESCAWGIEDPKLYVANLKAFRQAIAKKPESDIFLNFFLSALQSRASREANPELQKVLKTWQAFESEHIGFAAHLSFLQEKSRKFLAIDFTDPRTQSGASRTRRDPDSTRPGWGRVQLDWPMLVRFLELKRREGKIDRKKSEDEHKRLEVWSVQNGIPASSFPHAFRRESDPRLRSCGDDEECNLRAEWEKFYSEAAPQGFDFKDYPNLALYEGYRILESEIESEDLNKEIEKLQDLILNKLAASEKEKEIVAEFRKVLLLKKLASLELSREDWDSVSRIAYRVSSEKFKTQAEFYRLAEKREQAFMTHLAKPGARHAPRATVLITGGFHTPGLTKQLREKNISYAVIQPHMATLEDRKNYLEAMTAAKPRWDFGASTLTRFTWMTPVRLLYEAGLPKEDFSRRSEIRNQILREFSRRGATRAEMRSKGSSNEYLLNYFHRDKFVLDHFREGTLFDTQPVPVGRRIIVFPKFKRGPTWQPILGHLWRVGKRGHSAFDPRAIVHVITIKEGDEDKVVPFRFPDGRLDYLFILPLKDRIRIYDSAQRDPHKNGDSQNYVEPLLDLSARGKNFHAAKSPELSTFFLRLLTHYSSQWHPGSLSHASEDDPHPPEITVGTGVQGRRTTFTFPKGFKGRVEYLTYKGNVPVSGGIPMRKIYADKNDSKPMGAISLIDIENGVFLIEPIPFEHPPSAKTILWQGSSLPLLRILHGDFPLAVREEEVRWLYDLQRNLWERKSVIRMKVINRIGSQVFSVNEHENQFSDFDIPQEERLAVITQLIEQAANYFYGKNLENLSRFAHLHGWLLREIAAGMRAHRLQPIGEGLRHLLKGVEDEDLKVALQFASHYLISPSQVPVLVISSLLHRFESGEETQVAKENGHAMNLQFADFHPDPIFILDKKTGNVDYVKQTRDENGKTYVSVDFERKFDPERVWLRLYYEDGSNEGKWRYLTMKPYEVWVNPSNPAYKMTLRYEALMPANARRYTLVVSYDNGKNWHWLESTRNQYLLPMKDIVLVPSKGEATSPTRSEARAGEESEPTAPVPSQSARGEARRADRSKARATGPRSIAKLEQEQVKARSEVRMEKQEMSKQKVRNALTELAEQLFYIQDILEEVSEREFEGYSSLALTGAEKEYTASESADAWEEIAARSHETSRPDPAFNQEKMQIDEFINTFLIGNPGSAVIEGYLESIKKIFQILIQDRRWLNENAPYHQDVIEPVLTRIEKVLRRMRTLRREIPKWQDIQPEHRVRALKHLKRIYRTLIAVRSRFHPFDPKEYLADIEAEILDPENLPFPKQIRFLYTKRLWNRSQFLFPSSKGPIRLPTIPKNFIGKKLVLELDLAKNQERVNRPIRVVRVYEEKTGPRSFRFAYMETADRGFVPAHETIGVDQNYQFQHPLFPGETFTVSTARGFDRTIDKGRIRLFTDFQERLTQVLDGRGKSLPFFEVANDLTRRNSKRTGAVIKRSNSLYYHLDSEKERALRDLPLIKVGNRRPAAYIRINGSNFDVVPVDFVGRKADVLFEKGFPLAARVAGHTYYQMLRRDIDGALVKVSRQGFFDNISDFTGSILRVRSSPQGTASLGSPHTGVHVADPSENGSWITAALINGVIVRTDEWKNFPPPDVYEFGVREFGQITVTLKDSPKRLRSLKSHHFIILRDFNFKPLNSSFSRIPPAAYESHSGVITGLKVLKQGTVTLSGGEKYKLPTHYRRQPVTVFRFPERRMILFIVHKKNGAEVEDVFLYRLGGTAIKEDVKTLMAREQDLRVQFGYELDLTPVWNRKIEADRNYYLGLRAYHNGEFDKAENYFRRVSIKSRFLHHKARVFLMKHIPNKVNGAVVNRSEVREGETELPPFVDSEYSPTRSEAREKIKKEKRLQLLKEAAASLGEGERPDAKTLRAKTGLSRTQFYTIGRKNLIRAGVALSEPIEQMKKAKAEKERRLYQKRIGGIQEAVARLQKKSPEIELSIALIAGTMTALNLETVNRNTLWKWFEAHRDEPEVKELKKIIDGSSRIKRIADIFNAAEPGTMTEVALRNKFGMKGPAWTNYKKRNLEALKPYLSQLEKPARAHPPALPIMNEGRRLREIIEAFLNAHDLFSEVYIYKDAGTIEIFHSTSLKQEKGVRRAASIITEESLRRVTGPYETLAEEVTKKFLTMHRLHIYSKDKKYPKPKLAVPRASAPARSEARGDPFTQLGGSQVTLSTSDVLYLDHRGRLYLVSHFDPHGDSSSWSLMTPGIKHEEFAAALKNLRPRIDSVVVQYEDEQSFNARERGRVSDLISALFDEIKSKKGISDLLPQGGGLRKYDIAEIAYREMPPPDAKASREDSYRVRVKLRWQMDWVTFEGDLYRAVSNIFRDFKVRFYSKFPKNIGLRIEKDGTIKVLEKFESKFPKNGKVLFEDSADGLKSLMKKFGLEFVTISFEENTENKPMLWDDVSGFLSDFFANYEEGEKDSFQDVLTRNSEVTLTDSSDKEGSRQYHFHWSRSEARQVNQEDPIVQVRLAILKVTGYAGVSPRESLSAAERTKNFLGALEDLIEKLKKAAQAGRLAAYPGLAQDVKKSFEQAIEGFPFKDRLKEAPARDRLKGMAAKYHSLFDLKKKPQGREKTSQVNNANQDPSDLLEKTLNEISNIEGIASGLAAEEQKGKWNNPDQIRKIAVYKNALIQIAASFDDSLEEKIKQGIVTPIEDMTQAAHAGSLADFLRERRFTLGRSRTPSTFFMKLAMTAGEILNWEALRKMAVTVEAKKGTEPSIPLTLVVLFSSALKNERDSLSQKAERYLLAFEQAAYLPKEASKDWNQRKMKLKVYFVHHLEELRERLGEYSVDAVYLSPAVYRKMNPDHRGQLKEALGKRLLPPDIFQFVNRKIRPNYGGLLHSILQRAASREVSAEAVLLPRSEVRAKLTPEEVTEARALDFLRIHRELLRIFSEYKSAGAAGGDPQARAALRRVKNYGKIFDKYESEIIPSNPNEKDEYDYLVSFDNGGLKAEAEDLAGDVKVYTEHFIEAYRKFLATKNQAGRETDHGQYRKKLEQLNEQVVNLLKRRLKIQLIRLRQALLAAPIHQATVFTLLISVQRIYHRLAYEHYWRRSRRLEAPPVDYLRFPMVDPSGQIVENLSYEGPVLRMEKEPSGKLQVSQILWKYVEVEGGIKALEPVLTPMNFEDYEHAFRGKVHSISSQQKDYRQLKYHDYALQAVQEVLKQYRDAKSLPDDLSEQLTASLEETLVGPEGKWGLRLKRKRLTRAKDKRGEVIPMPRASLELAQTHIKNGELKQAVAAIESAREWIQAHRRDIETSTAPATRRKMNYLFMLMRDSAIKSVLLDLQKIDIPELENFSQGQPAVRDLVNRLEAIETTYFPFIVRQGEAPEIAHYRDLGEIVTRYLNLLRGVQKGFEDARKTKIAFASLRGVRKKGVIARDIQTIDTRIAERRQKLSRSEARTKAETYQESEGEAASPAKTYHRYYLGNARARRYAKPLLAVYPRPVQERSESRSSDAAIVEIAHKLTKDIFPRSEARRFVTAIFGFSPAFAAMAENQILNDAERRAISENIKLLQMGGNVIFDLRSLRQVGDDNIISEVFKILAEKIEGSARIHIANADEALQRNPDLHRGLAGRVRIHKESELAVATPLAGEGVSVAFSRRDSSASGLRMTIKGIHGFMIEPTSLKSYKEKIQYIVRLSAFLLFASQLNEDELRQLMNQMGLGATNGLPQLTAEFILSQKFIEALNSAATSRAA